VTRTEVVEIGSNEIILAIKVETVGESPCKVYFVVYDLGEVGGETSPTNPSSIPIEDTPITSTLTSSPNPTLPVEDE